MISTFNERKGFGVFRLIKELCSVASAAYGILQINFSWKTFSLIKIRIM